MAYFKFAKKNATPGFLACKDWSRGQTKYWIGNKKASKAQYKRYVKKAIKGKRGSKVVGWSVYKGN